MNPSKKKAVPTSDIPFKLPDVTLPFSKGWMREVVKRSLVKKGRKNYDVYYFTPEGSKLRSMKEIGKYLEKNKIDELKEENFSFTEKLIFKEPFERQRNANDFSFKEIVPMKKDVVKKDVVKKEVKKDIVKKDIVKKEEVKKEEVKKEEVKKDEVKKDEVKKDEVKKDEVKKDVVKKEVVKKVQNVKSLVDANDVSKKKASPKEKIIKVKIPTKSVNKGVNKSKVKVRGSSRSAKVSKKVTRKMPPRSSKTNIKSLALNLNKNNVKDIKDDLFKLRANINGNAAASKAAI